MRGPLSLSIWGGILGLLLIVGSLLGVGIQERFRTTETLRLLEHRDRTALALQESLQEGGSLTRAQATILARSNELQITITDRQGQVIVDVPGGREPGTNLSGRSEITRALAGEVGSTERFSGDTGDRVSFTALPIPSGVVRVGTSLTPVDLAVARHRGGLLYFGTPMTLGVGLAICLLVSLALQGALQQVWRLLARLHPTLEPQGRDFGSLASFLLEMGEQHHEEVSALTDDRNRLDAVLQEMREGMIALDPERRIEMVNRRAREMFNLPQDAMGRPLIDCLRVPAMHDLLADLDDTEPRSAEVELRVPQPRTLMARLTPRLAGGGSILVLYDISEIRRLERVRQDFIANVSHELRTPVTVIRANAELLLDTPTEMPSIDRELLEAIGRNAERLTSMITAQLDLSRIESGNRTLTSEPVSVEAMLEKVWLPLSTVSRQRDIQVELAPCKDLWVLADPHALEQILANFLQNAIAYAGSGAQITLRAVPDVPNRVKVEVEDNGPGIEVRHRRRIFERFYRVDEGRSPGQGGTGLGLSIAKHLATTMGGEIGMRGAPVRGSCFWVSLPSVPPPSNPAAPN